MTPHQRAMARIAWMEWTEFQESRWVEKIMDHHMYDLGTAAMWEWYKVRDRYPTRQQWEALNPSPGQSYQPFSLPRPPE